MVSLFCPEGRVSAHSDCLGGGLLPSSSGVSGGMVLDEIDTCITKKPNKLKDCAWFIK